MRLTVDLVPASFVDGERLEVQLLHKGEKYGYTEVYHPEAYESVLDVMFDHALTSSKRAFIQAMKEKRHD